MKTLIHLLALVITACATHFASAQRDPQLEKFLAERADRQRRAQASCQAEFNAAWRLARPSLRPTATEKGFFDVFLAPAEISGCYVEKSMPALQRTIDRKATPPNYSPREAEALHASNVAMMCVYRFLASPQCTAGGLATAQAHRLTNEQVMANCSSEMAMSDAALVQSWEKSAQETWRLARELKAKGSRYELKEEAARKLEARAADLRSAGFRSEHSIAMGNPASFYRDRTVPQLQELMGILKAKAQSGTHIDRGSAPSLICIIQLELSARQSKASAGAASPVTAPPAKPNTAQAQQRQAALDEQRRGKPKRHYAEREAHHCLTLWKENTVTGGFINTCDFPVTFIYCAYKPKKGSWTESLTCEGKTSHVGGNFSVQAHDRSSHLTLGAQKILWFACRSDSTKEEIFEVGDGEFDPSGPFIRARCVKWGDRS